jgi:hypothetical protein
MIEIKRQTCLWIWGIVFAASLSRTGYADFTIHVGPTSMGSGGSNPISIPPVSLQEYEFVWVSDSKTEYSVSIIPGLLIGQRYPFTNAYVSLGGGLVIGINGIGPGIYTASGMDFCSNEYCFNIELKNALGFTRQSLIMPYALRIGLTVKM